MAAGLGGTVTPGDLSQAAALLLISRFHLGLLPGMFISRAEGWRWDWSQASEGALSEAEDEGALGQGGAVGSTLPPPWGAFSTACICQALRGRAAPSHTVRGRRGEADALTTQRMNTESER